MITLFELISVEKHLHDHKILLRKRLDL